MEDKKKKKEDKKKREASQKVYNIHFSWKLGLHNSECSGMFLKTELSGV